MANIKSIFNHPKKENPEKDTGLYDWRRPAYKKDDVGNLNRILKNLTKTKKCQMAQIAEWRLWKQRFSCKVGRHGKLMQTKSHI